MCGINLNFSEVPVLFLFLGTKPPNISFEVYVFTQLVSLTGEFAYKTLLCRLIHINVNYKKNAGRLWKGSVFLPDVHDDISTEETP
jgi:hypothetical protein